MNLSDKLSPTGGENTEPKPEFFDLSQSKDEARLEALLEENPHIKIIDTYESQLKEYFVLQNPPLHMNPPERDKQFESYRDEHYGGGEPHQAGHWVYFPWRHTVLHILDGDGFQQVRTARNRNLIPAAEQTQYYNSTIAIGGLSVGNSIALSIVLTGGGKHMKLADPDTLELTNLNRIRASVTDLTEPKVYFTARQIYELDPYADLTLYTDGITEGNIAEFCAGADIIIDEIDNLAVKIHLRDQAKANKIPVVMATDNGDSGLIDVERHDREEVPYFHGRIDEQDIAEMLSGKLPLPLVGKKIGEKLVGFDITEPRMQQSLLEIGRSIPTWPQLGGAALLNGVAVAATVRKILTDQPVIDNRAILSLSSWLIPDYDSPDQVEERKQGTEKFIHAYNAAIDQFLAMIKKKGPPESE